VGKLMLVGTFGTDDPTRATLPFLMASGALDSGHEPTIVLLAEATYLLKQGIADEVHGYGYPPLSKLVAKIMENKVPIYV
jgi:predicted peroxiredoxin